MEEKTIINIIVGSVTFLVLVPLWFGTFFYSIMVLNNGIFAMLSALFGFGGSLIFAIFLSLYLESWFEKRKHSIEGYKEGL